MQNSNRLKRVISIVANSALVLSAIIVAGSVVHSRYMTTVPSTSSAMFSEQKDWETFADAGSMIGDPSAPVVLIEFGDFECPACRTLSTHFRELLAKRPGEVAVLYRHMPLSKHRFAESAAIASECGARQTSFEQIHDSLFAHQKQLGLKPWTEIAFGAGVADTTAFSVCMRDSSTFSRIAADKKAAERLGANGTPTVLINGVRFSGVPHRRTLDSLVTEALRVRRARVS